MQLFLFCPLCSFAFCVLFGWIINLHASHTIKCHDRQKASFSSFQQIYFGRVKALPYYIALVCFCYSLYRTSESLRGSLSAFCCAGASTTSSLCAWYQREYLRLCNEGAGWVKGIAMKQQTYTLPTAPRRKRRQQLSVTAHLSFSPLLRSCFLCYMSSLLWLPFSWAPWGKCAIPVRRTPTKQRNSSIWSSWSVFKNAVLGSCLDRSSFFFKFELRHDSVVEGKGGRKPRQTVGSQPDSKKDRQAEGGRSGQVGSTSILWSGCYPLVAVWANRNQEFSGEEGKPELAEVADANAMYSIRQKAFY